MSRKEQELSNHKKFRTWISKQVFLEYKMTQRDGSRILSALYGQHRDCDASGFIDYIQRQDIVFDLLSTDTQTMESSLTIAESWLETKNLRGVDGPFLLGTALYLTLVLMGARHTGAGFCGHDLIKAAKVERAAKKRAIIEADERKIQQEEDKQRKIEKDNAKKLATEGNKEDAEIAKAMEAISLISAEWADEE